MDKAMRRLQACCIVAFAFCAADVQAGEVVLPNGKLVQHEAFRGAPRWELIPFLWTDKTLNITCPFAKVRSPPGHGHVSESRGSF